MSTVYGDISDEEAGQMVKKMLEHANPELVLSLFGQSMEYEENATDTLTYTRGVPFEVTTEPIIEGVTPSPDTLRFERVRVKIQQYGKWVRITDKAETLARMPRKALAVTQMLLGEYGGKLVEMIIYGKLKAGTSVFYDTNAHTLRSQVNSVLTKKRLQAVVRALKANLAKFVTERVSASPKYSTEPVHPSFICFTHTDVESDISEIDGFLPSEKYGNEAAIVHPYEYGKIGQVRFISSPMLEPFKGAGASVGSTGMLATGGKIDVYPLLIIGKGAYGSIPLKGKNAIVPMVIAADRPSKSDPLGLNGSASIKFYHASEILNQLWIMRLEVAVSDI